MFLRKSTLAAIASALLASSALAQTQPYFRSVAPSFAPATPPGNPNNPGNPTDPETTAPLEVSISSAPGEGMAGIAIPSFGYAIAGGKGPYTVTVPGGPDLVASGGQVSGTPLNPGLYDYTVRVVDADNAVATADATILVHPAFAVDASGASSAQEGSQTTISISSIGGKAPVTYGMDGSIPGMTFSGNSLTGAPTTAGTFDFTLWAQDSFLGRVERPRSLTVTPNPYTLALSAGTLNMRSGGTRTKTVITSIPNPAYSLFGAPSYVTITPQGLLTVQAPVVTETTTIPGFRLRAENGLDETQSREIEVASLGIIRPTLAIASSAAEVTGTIGQAITPVTFTLIGADAGATPNVTVTPSDRLGLVISTSGVTGTPTRAGTGSVTLSYTHPADNIQVNETFAISIAKSIEIVMPATTTYTGSPNQPIVSQAPSVTGNLGTVTWSIVNESNQPLAGGFSVDDATGVITLNSASAGQYRAYLRATEDGQSVRATVPIVFNLSAPDASTTRPVNINGGANNAVFVSGGQWPTVAIGIPAMYDESDTTYATATGTAQRKITFFFPPGTYADCARVRARASYSGAKMQLGLYSAAEGFAYTEFNVSTSTAWYTVHSAPRSVVQVDLNHTGPNSSANVVIYEFQLGVKQPDDSCLTAP